MKHERTLITGSSSGIGLHLAYQFAAHGHPLVLVAPDAEELEQIQSEIQSRYAVEVQVIAADLEDPTAPQTIYNSLSKACTDIRILVNNAGHGFRGKTWELTIDQDLSMIRLNIEAVVRMTQLFLPDMISRGAGRILNTASVAGFEPGPLLNVYHSTKAFVLSYTEALAVELEDTGVVATALCPGPTDTDFFPKAGMVNVMAFQKAVVSDPQSVAIAGYEGLMDGKLFVVPGAANKALVMSRRILSEEAQAALNQKFYEEVPPDEREKRRGDWESKGGMPEPTT